MTNIDAIENQCPTLTWVPNGRSGVTTSGCGRYAFWAVDCGAYAEYRVVRSESGSHHQIGNARVLHEAEDIAERDAAREAGR